MKKKWPWIAGGIFLIMTGMIPSVLRFLTSRGWIQNPETPLELHDQIATHDPGSHMKLAGGFLSFGMGFGVLFFIGFTALMILGIMALYKVVTDQNTDVPPHVILPPYCTKCGHSLQPDWKHCPNCGASRFPQKE